ncbi:AAA family ATPase [Sphingosinicella rhizophila]|uniref:AAA family ATPase n=1 Tax=Sphingosinicella rhizophila TaxID=3050082 RepID=A0ABU3QB78_9SPHN|nr:AAA family ATPase [Sphingosinicella sp. GR2756]MDT9600660.1 AAA family ATPase [Sphingosinicella sp. GR2756]
MNPFVVISGCSGGGKSSLIQELARRGYAVVEEPGRRIVAEERAAGGRALPWTDLAAFARRAIAVAAADRTSHEGAGDWVFFDRGLVDVAVALAHATAADRLDPTVTRNPYHRAMFMAPPWPEIYETDDARLHSLDEAVAEYDRLLPAYRDLGYDITFLPKIGIEDRADFVVERLAMRRR